MKGAVKTYREIIENVENGTMENVYRNRKQVVRDCRQKADILPLQPGISVAEYPSLSTLLKLLRVD
jgi:hypothetical protein